MQNNNFDYNYDSKRSKALELLKSMYGEQRGTQTLRQLEALNFGNYDINNSNKDSDNLRSCSTSNIFYLFLAKVPMGDDIARRVYYPTLNHILNNILNTRKSLKERKAAFEEVFPVALGACNDQVKPILLAKAYSLSQANIGIDKSIMIKEMVSSDLHFPEVTEIKGIVNNFLQAYREKINRDYPELLYEYIGNEGVEEIINQNNIKKELIDRLLRASNTSSRRREIETFKNEKLAKLKQVYDRCKGHSTQIAEPQPDTDKFTQVSHSKEAKARADRYRQSTRRRENRHNDSEIQFMDDGGKLPSRKPNVPKR